MTTYVTVVFREQRRRSASDRVVCGTIRSGVKFAIQYMQFYEYNILFVRGHAFESWCYFFPESQYFGRSPHAILGKTLMLYSMRISTISKYQGK